MKQVKDFFSFVKNKVGNSKAYILTFSKWIFLSVIMGLLGGFVGTVFHISVEEVTFIREANPILICFLPIAGLAIIFIYKTFRLENKGTNNIINKIRTDEKIPFMLAPLIFVGTTITHLFGGSAGREGAALQLGGSIGYQIGRVFKLDEKDLRIIVLCGMSAVFSANFGTPITATLFALEVISVGVIYYSALLPCTIASVMACQVALYMGVAPDAFHIDFIPQMSVSVVTRTIILALLCALVSVIFCSALHRTERFFKKVLPNEYHRIFVGGLCIVALTFLVGSTEYNGSGFTIIERAMEGQVRPEAFILKIIFTAITMGVGFKGGEIVPTFFVGATFGCFVGTLMGLNPGFAAAVGLIAMFCGVVNCPIASIMLGLELFGSDCIVLFLVVCSVSYMLSGYRGLYSSQKIIYSKLKAEYINIFAK